MSGVRCCDDFWERMESDPDFRDEMIEQQHRLSCARNNFCESRSEPSRGVPGHQVGSAVSGFRTPINRTRDHASDQANCESGVVA